MNNRDMKKLLRDSIDMEQELYDFCVECLTKMYGENAPIAINSFEEGYDSYQYNGCIQPLCCVDKAVELSIKAKEEEKKKKTEK